MFSGKGTTIKQQISLQDIKKRMRQLANGENSIKRSLIPSNTSFSCFYG
jgi:hypothetical protein